MFANSLTSRGRNQRYHLTAGYSSDGDIPVLNTKAKLEVREPSPELDPESAGVSEAPKGHASNGDGPTPTGSASPAAVPEAPYWVAPILSFFDKIRAAFGEARPVRLAGGCSGIFSECAAMKAI